MKKTVVYICKNGENAIENMRGDGLLIMGCGYGDPGRSGMKEAFGDMGDEFLYRLGDEKPYRFAYYYCGNGSPSEALKCLLSQGCRSVIVDFGIGTDDVRLDWVRDLTQLEDVIVVNSDRRIRHDLKVGELARIAFSTYLQSQDCDPAEVALLQDGDYCHNTFILNSTMPVLVPESVIGNAPNGARVGESDFYQAHYWSQVIEADGVKYRIVNDWKEPTKTQPRDNRTPLEDWIRRMGIHI